MPRKTAKRLWNARFIACPINLIALQPISHFIILLAAGHIFVPQGLFFVRFLNFDHAKTKLDYAILFATATALACSHMAMRYRSIIASIAATALYIIATAIAFDAWSDPRHELFAANAIPFAVITLLLGIRMRHNIQIGSSSTHCHTCSYDLKDLGPGTTCPECGSPRGGSSDGAKSTNDGVFHK